jgi:hypothetical protein
VKIALVTTTIHTPKVLELLTRLNPDVRVFVAGDEKTPQEAADFCHDLNGVTYLSPEYQRSLNYRCSDLIGFSCIQRRNIATLEALRYGADVIVSWDTDNIPMDEDYFCNFDEVLNPEHLMGKRCPFSGLLVDTTLSWFDPGQLLSPPARHRGFPYQLKSQMEFKHVVEAKVGVAAGLCLGDPDVGAADRLATRPAVHSVTELARAGVVLDPRRHHTVFNSQNTAFIRELAPAMFMLPHIGRFDDIFASLITQRVMRERGLHVHFGQPFCWQARNAHDLVKDLKEETFGMEHLVEFAAYLAGFQFQPGRTVVDMVRMIFNSVAVRDILPAPTCQAGFAWCDDCEQVLG